MTKNITLMEFLRFISACNGDEGIEIISQFQSGAITIEGIDVADVNDDD